jgi:hypothetical protein
MAPLGSRGRVTDLDRAGVIDVDKLASVQPDLAKSVRYKLPDWIAAREREASKIASVAGLLVCIANVIILAFALRLRSVHASAVISQQIAT